MNILYLEDEQAIAKIVADSLGSRGFNVTHHTCGHEAIKSFSLNKPDIVVLDITMPEIDGFDVVVKIRKLDPQTPIIFVTARTQINDVVMGFEIGANDYLKKPFSMEELIVRINALLKPKFKPLTLSIGKYSFDIRNHCLMIAGNSRSLSYRESELLRILVERKNTVVKRSDILKELWDYETLFTGRSLDVFISRLRTYLKTDSELKIVTVRGIGYMLLIAQTVSHK